MEQNETISLAETQIQTQLPEQAVNRAQEATAQAAEDERLLGDLTFAQVMATALAAATSFALSNQIGIAGSLIGTVIGTAVTVVAGQVYKQLIKRSARKLGSLAHHETETVPAPAHAAPEATPEKPLHLNRWAIVAALLAAALLAVGIYTALVNVATEGEGIGDKPQIVYVVVQEPAETDETPVEEPAENENAVPDSPDTTDAAEIPDDNTAPLDTTEPTDSEETTPSEPELTDDQPADTAPEDSTSPDGTAPSSDTEAAADSVPAP